MKTKTVVCEDCRGAGIREGEKRPCPLCGGRGERKVVYERDDIQTALRLACAELTLRGRE